jgi:hypothetical protein
MVNIVLPIELIQPSLEEGVLSWHLVGLSVILWAFFFGSTATHVRVLIITGSLNQQLCHRDLPG